MTGLYQIYECGVCGNMVEVLHTGKGQLVCCNKPMDLMAENTVDASKEIHVPVVERSGEKTTVKVGSVPHPMEEKHYIEWIEIITGEGNYRQFLKPGEPPEAEFISRADIVTARVQSSRSLEGMTGGGFVNLKALHKISYGLYIVTSRKGGRFNGQVANTVFQISSGPPTVAVSINKQNLTSEFI